MRMFRSKSARLSLMALAFSIIGCGGEKHDFSSPPKSYALADLTPLAVGDATLQGVSDDGRVVGTYLKEAGKPVQPFGWTPDGDMTDFTLPTQCKQMDGINEIGQIACSDQSAKPIKFYLWQTSAIDELKLPVGTTAVSVGAMSFGAGVAATVTKTAATDSVQLKVEEEAKALTTSGSGRSLGASQAGNIVGVDAASGHSKGFAVIDGQKRDIVSPAGTDTYARGVNDTGTVVGNSADGATNHKAFSWQSGTFKVLTLPSGATESEANFVNNEGVIAGKALVGATWEACIWFPGKPPTLVKSLTAVPSGVVLNDARVVTPLGIVVCEATKKISGTDHTAVCVLRPQY